MTKVSINLLNYSTPWEEIKKCLEHALSQDFDDFEVYYMENASHGNDNHVNEVKAEFGSNPRLKVIDNKGNLGYADGHNKFFKNINSELLMVLNPDALLEPTFVSEIIKVFENPLVGAATGKMLKPGKTEQGKEILDGTGIIISKSRRGKERGQLEIDEGQYDSLRDIFGVSGTAAVFRKTALESVKILNHEYYDPDFFAYWEDLDLSWRMRLQGWQIQYMPSARVYHPRAVGASPGGLKRFVTFVKHHRSFSLNIRRWNWRNHLFAIIKNDFGWNFWKATPLIFIRELSMAIFITVFSFSTWSVLPEFFKLLPKMFVKRRIIQSRRKVSSKEMEKWFV
ncbi:MAG: glycosyltransferase family 2 protein [Patescibacteria group bacterium]